MVTGAASGIGAALAPPVRGRRARAASWSPTRRRTRSSAWPREHRPTRLAVRVRRDRRSRSSARSSTATEARFGPIDLFCSNAGDRRRWAGPTRATRSGSLSLDVNVMAHVYAARILVPRMIERGGGYLLQTASAAGLLTQLGSRAVLGHEARGAGARRMARDHLRRPGPEGVGARAAGGAHRDDGGRGRRRGRRRRRDARARRGGRRGGRGARRGVVPDPAAPAGARVLPAQGVRLRALDQRHAPAAGAVRRFGVRFTA